MRIAIGIGYDGSAFEGWQSQPSGRTVQDALERALAEIARAPVRLTGAGRTDAGVHALAQVAHFDVDVERPDQAWVRGVNTHLPDSVAVQWAVRTDPAFHARHCAVSRRYLYLLHNHPVRPALMAGRSGWFPLPLDIAAMREAAALLVGRHDFSSFRAAQCQANTPVRTLHALRLRARDASVVFDLTADAFLHHMVRNIVGCLVYVGCGRREPGWLSALLASRDRRHAAPTASAAGLYLAQVGYPARWRLPGFARIMPDLFE